ncbi:MAG TPA: hypothetical protein VLG39_08825 [Nitrospirota bacterium]|nr:hypothetical protein [Nitrospirota bacterium]
MSTLSLEPRSRSILNWANLTGDWYEVTLLFVELKLAQLLTNNADKEQATMVRILFGHGNRRRRNMGSLRIKKYEHFSHNEV